MTADDRREAAKLATRDALAARDAWAEAVWTDAYLRPLERLVALAYADHAREGLHQVWVGGDRLRARTGLSRDAANRALRALEAAGWLVVVVPAKQHRATRYRLTYPDLPGVGPTGQQSVSQNAEQYAGRNAEGLSSTPDGTLNRSSVPSPDASVPSPDASVTRDGTDFPSYLPSHLPTRATDGARERAALEVLVELEGGQVDDDVLQAAARWAAADASTTGSPAGRLRVAGYRSRAIAAGRGALRSVLEDRISALRSAQPECEHGDPGGAAPHPKTGQPLCALCRAARRPRTQAAS